MEKCEHRPFQQYEDMKRAVFELEIQDIGRKAAPVGHRMVNPETEVRVVANEMSFFRYVLLVPACQLRSLCTNYTSCVIYSLVLGFLIQLTLFLPAIPTGVFFMMQPDGISAEVRPFNVRILC